MKCYFCGNSESKRVCSEHTRTMLSVDELHKISTTSCDIYYKDENNNIYYDINDVRKEYSYNTIQYPSMKQEIKDAFFRFKNITETYYRKKLLRDKRKRAIEEFTYIAIKKLDMKYFPECKKDITNMIENLIDEKLTTPAECALKIYKAFEEHIMIRNAKKFRAELGLNFLNNQMEDVKKVFINGRLYEKLILGHITYDNFTEEVTNYVKSIKRQNLLEEAIEKYIPENYRTLCRDTMMAQTYIKSGDEESAEGTIRFFEFMIKKYELKKTRGIRTYKHALNFFETF